jgi:hypothetical protein
LSQGAVVVVWAPGHDLNDRRVNRVTEVLCALCPAVVVAYDRAHTLDRPRAASHGEHLQYVGEGRKGWFSALMGVGQWHRTLRPETRLLYLHDSGLYGLLLAATLRLWRPKLAVIFDYHDWIPWEIWYQWRKLIGWPALAGGLARLTQSLMLPLLGRAVRFQGIVGISRGQLEGLRRQVPATRQIPGLVIPNTRKRLPDPVDQVVQGKLTLLWVGNVMEGRDLDRLLLYTEALRRDEPNLEFSVRVVGRVLSSRMLQRLEAMPYVRHEAGFSDDEQLRRIIACSPTVGVFLGWDDTIGTGINQIASPNKVYSYVNIGIPVIYNSSLDAVADVIPSPSGLPVSDYASFRKSVLWGSAHYNTCAIGARMLRKQLIWDEDAKALLTAFLLDFLPRE